jgi:hypothetical protein
MLDLSAGALLSVLFSTTASLLGFAAARTVLREKVSGLFFWGGQWTAVRYLRDDDDDEEEEEEEDDDDDDDDDNGDDDDETANVVAFVRCRLRSSAVRCCERWSGPWPRRGSRPYSRYDSRP